MSVQFNSNSSVAHPSSSMTTLSQSTIQRLASASAQDQISSAASEPSCWSAFCELIQTLINGICSFFESLFTSRSDAPTLQASSSESASQVSSSEGALQASLSESISREGSNVRPLHPRVTSGYSCQVPTHLGTDISGHFWNANKRFAYHYLLEGAHPDALHFEFTKYALDDTEPVNAAPLFAANPPTVREIEGTFLYDPSTQESKHWVANFADSNLFGYAFTGLLAQDEIQILEHPSLYHLKLHLTNQGMSQLRGNQIALVEGVQRLGNLDTQTPLPSGRSLYGNNFAGATQEQIVSRLTRFENPHSSNLFCMAAPHIPSDLHNQPYQRRHLERLFYHSYTAFSAIKEKSQSAQSIIHTGNWGCGAFGNDAKTVALIQLAAARAAGIHEIRYYSLGSHQAFQEAQQLFNQIAQQNNAFTVTEFLDHLVHNAEAYGLRYGLGNGT